MAVPAVRPEPPVASPSSVRVDLRRLSPGDARRLVDIAVTLARHGAIVLGRRGPFIAVRFRRQAPKAFAVALRRSFVDLGPTFVKLGQVVASSPGLFPETLSQECRKLLDAVPPEPSGVIRHIVERELDAPLATVFSSFDPQPAASASIAQVHRATLLDGREVAVKVRRRRLRPRIERDLRLLKVLSIGLGRAGSAARILNPEAIVDDFATTLRAELDFRNEAAWMRSFGDNLRAFGTNDRIVVPEPVDDLVTERVLVMSWLDGTPVDDLPALQQRGLDFEDLLRRGVRAWLESALEHGLFHGDVHAGNLFVTPAGEVAFLDFGIMGHLDERVRSVLRRTMPAIMIDDDYTSVVRTFFELGAVDGPVDIERAAEDIRALAEPLVAKPLAEISYGEVLSSVLQVATRHRVRLPREMVLVIKQLLYFERYAKELAPDYAILADPRIVEFLAVDQRTIGEVERPHRTPRPRTADLDRPGGGLVVESLRDATFCWDHTARRPELARLYGKAKASQWNATTDLDWSIDVDPLDTSGMTQYLPLVASDAFQRFTDAERAHAAHHMNAWITSQFLHGEQGALLATAKLVQQVPWSEGKQYGATQVIDEARHVEAYSRYLREKLELTYPVNPNLRELLEIVIGDSRWDVTYLGMQIIVEGLALAAFGMIHQFSTEPLIKEITRYVMRDEARHVAFGALGLTGLYDEMTAAERREREDFVLEAAWLMRDRFLATEVWESLGIPEDDGLRDSSKTPMLQLFQRILFAKVTPNLNKIGLLTDRLRNELVAIGAIAPDA